MPRDTIRLQVSEQNEIHVEVTILDPVDDVSAPDFRFEDIGDKIVSIASAFQEVMAKVRPRSASVEFGIEIGLEAGKITALLVKGTATANLKITLCWEERPSQNAGADNAKPT